MTVRVPVLSPLIATFLLFASLPAQVTREHDVALKNWPAPLYWQPTPAETQAGGLKSAVQPAASHATAYALVFVAMRPCRVVDTRAGQMFAAPFGAPSMFAGSPRSFPLQSSSACTIPANAQAYSVIVTLVPPGPVGYLIIWPTVQSQPNVVTLDDVAGQIVNTAAILPAGTPNGSVTAVVSATTDLVFDINGYYAAPNTVGTGSENTATGFGTLANNTSGNFNTATGFEALFSNTSGLGNTANGVLALSLNTSGTANTASGYLALYNNTTGGDNTASGSNVLLNNTTGSYNTANGNGALSSNTTASGNTATGYNALDSNTTGSENTATGYNALFSNTTASLNTANGTYALFSNTTGTANTASGFLALYNNTTGGDNTASGASALLNNTTGYYNTALGYLAGENITTGSNNIDIGNPGDASDGAAVNSGVIRIGDNASQKSFFAAGIAGVTVSNSAPVLIDTASGQLGTASSSRRYKEDIQDMAEASDGLLKLRPVTFRYKKPYAGGSQPIDYGLIAEEVAEVYPDLVSRNAGGQIETVQYHKLVPMLLNELQKEHSAREHEQPTVRALQERLAALEKALATLLAGQTQPTDQVSSRAATISGAH